MSKRVRGSRRPSPARAATRPVRREPVAATGPAEPIPDGAVPNVLAAEAAAAFPRAGQLAPRGTQVRVSTLASKAAAEYVYVGQDLRHIAMMAGLLGAILAVLFVLIDVLHVIQL
ncbi:MAG: hypothetical protein ACHQZR_00615 [Candidatus Limnocylindrales bacterium]